MSRAHCGHWTPCTQTGKLAPGSWQQLVPTPHCSEQGQAVQPGGAKYPRQTPSAHTWLALHATSQSPQLSGSRWSWAGVRHALLQVCRPIDEQPTSWQTPSTHDLLHSAPQAPQCCALLVTSTQAPAQSVRPERHAQAPASQSSAPSQLAPQAPQLVGLVCKLTQALPQVSAPVHAHTP